MSQRSVHVRDLAKAPTAITAASFASVIYGARHIETTKGKLAVGIGRFGDLVDGFVARRFDQSTDAGAIADVTSDKLGMAAICAALWHKDVAPKPVILNIVARNIINSCATVHHGVTDTEHESIRPPKSGKYAMAADNLAIASYLTADALRKNPKTERAFRLIGHTAAAAGFIIGTHATTRYVKGDFDDAH